MPFDGKDHPFQSSAMDGLTLAVTPIDDHTLNFVLKKDGKEITTGTRTIAKDGKSFILATKGTTPDGKPVETSLVYNRK